MRSFISKLVEDPTYWAIKLIAANQRVVFTNGCFDLIHVGHIAYLTAARKLGDVLIVAVNDDDSVRALKGPTRPINTLEDRLRVIAALECVDAVVAMHALRNTELLKAIQPTIWVKGGDYTLSSLDPEEVAAAKQIGTEIHILPAIAGRSTSALIAAFN